MDGAAGASIGSKKPEPSRPSPLNRFGLSLRAGAADRPQNHNFFLTENILKSKFQTIITFTVVLLMNQNFKNMCKSTFCLYLRIIITVCAIKFEIFTT